MKLEITKNEWGGLFQRLDRLEKAPRLGVQIMLRGSRRMGENVREHFETQGRGGAPPSLSPATTYIYSIDGDPDGSGIVNHLTLQPLAKTGKTFTAIFGVPEGKPTMLMIVQNDGCRIKVTDKMRGFLAARYGIFLRDSTTEILIPGRGVWDESIKKTRRAVRKQLKRFFKELFSS